tara:strand:- start:198 stop:893 length:696 start_codon:yes stop_codon:yes gene_type:complete
MVFLIAELGVNWDGDFDLAKKMMSNAKTLGFNAVKFQAFNEDTLGNHTHLDRLMKSAITEKNVQQIDKIANDIGIEWFCTPMYPEAVSFLNPFVTRFKIREIDGRILLRNQKTPLIEAIINTEKEIFVSSETSPESCKYYHNPNIKWLYCIPKYPCSLDEINFKEISKFHGFSNHCPEITALLTAVNSGIDIIEVHVTEDKTKEYFDNNVSFDFSELKILIAEIKKINKNN